MKKADVKCKQTDQVVFLSTESKQQIESLVLIHRAFLLFQKYNSPSPDTL